MLLDIVQRPRGSRSASTLGSLGVSPEDALSVGEIAKLFGVTRNSAHRYTQRPEFPEPLAVTSGGRVWLRRDVERWGRERLPLQTGRPPKQEETK
jgi:predicted DNA-binding transcriptional regulator AlpA